MSTKSLALEEQRSRLERRANVIRARLLRTIDALDTRRHQVTEIGHHAKRLAIPVAASVIGVAVIAAGTTFAIKALLEHRRERRFGYRLAKSLAPLRREERPPFWQEALRKVTLTALGVLAGALVRRGAKVMSEGRPSQRPPQLPSAATPPLLGP
jgi:hypothetical protein